MIRSDKARWGQFRWGGDHLGQGLARYGRPGYDDARYGAVWTTFWCVLVRIDMARWGQFGSGGDHLGWALLGLGAMGLGELRLGSMG